MFPVTEKTDRGGFKISSDRRSFTVYNVQKFRADGNTDLMTLQCSISNKHGEKIAGAYLNVLCKLRCYPQSTFLLQAY